MAVPSSGQLRLRADIANEVNGSATGINVSLRSLSASAGKSAPDNMSEFYGYSSAIPPSVTTNGISQLGETGFRANGNISSDGGGTITQRGFYVGRSTNATSNAKYIVGGTTGGVSTYISGLLNNTTYYIYRQN